MEVLLLVTDFLDRAVRLYPEKLAIVDGPRRYSYRDLERISGRYACDAHCRR